MISIIIVHYRTPERLRECLASLREARLPEVPEILVVDNNSQCDGELRRLCNSARYPVKLRLSGRNEGLACAANRAFRESRGEFILNLNPDVLVTGDAVARLHEHLVENPGTGVVFPKLLNPDGTLQHSCRRAYDWQTIVLRRTPLGRSQDGRRVRRHLMMDYDHKETREVDWALGAAFMMRRSAAPEHGLFDQRYFLYLEDVDLCADMWKRGWKVVYHPDAIMVHDHRRGSAGNPLGRENRSHLVSCLRYCLKHRGFKTARRRKEIGKQPC
jgi:N-acetylglucosaminyl-diphospho-decaprenol L-rhamnosyltransferase